MDKIIKNADVEITLIENNWDKYKIKSSLEEKEGRNQTCDTITFCKPNNFPNGVIGFKIEKLEKVIDINKRKEEIKRSDYVSAYSGQILDICDIHVRYGENSIIFLKNLKIHFENGVRDFILLRSPKGEERIIPVFPGRVINVPKEDLTDVLNYSLTRLVNRRYPNKNYVKSLELRPAK